LTFVWQVVACNSKTVDMQEMNNRVILTGHLGRDPEVRVFGENKKMARMSLAVNGSFKMIDGESKPQTEWHNIVAWGKLAEWVEHQFVKGNKVCVEGKLSSRTYTGKDGIKRYTTEIVASTMEHVEPKA
jgi:single-strand DNA-binding protein